MMVVALLTVQAHVPQRGNLELELQQLAIPLAPARERQRTLDPEATVGHPDPRHRLGEPRHRRRVSVEMIRGATHRVQLQELTMLRPQERP